MFFLVCDGLKALPDAVDNARPGDAGHDGQCGWKPALNAVAITFADRWPAAETY